MPHAWIRALCCLALALMTEPLTAEAQQIATRKITVTITHDAEPFAGVILAPVPPNTDSQRVISSEMIVKTSKGTTKARESHEAGPLKSRILTVPANPDEKMRIVLTLEIDLQPAPGPVRIGRTIGTLTNEQRTRYSEARGWRYEHDAESFRSWMKTNGLFKGKKESDVQFAYRALAFMHDEFTYKIPDEEYMRAKIEERGTGDLGFFTSEKSGECLALSSVYVCVLRANGIPSRAVTGWVLRDSAHHVRAEVFLHNLGWMHVEVAGCVAHKEVNLADSFGRGGSYMIVMNEGLNYALPGPNGVVVNRGCFAGIGLCKEDADWEFPDGTFSVSERKRVMTSNGSQRVAAPAGPFQAKSIWVGEDPKKILTVIERKGETFRARFDIGSEIEREVTGTIKDGKLSWFSKDVRVIKGDRGGDNSGTITRDDAGDMIDFEYRGADGTGGSYTLRLRKGK